MDRGELPGTLPAPFVAELFSAPLAMSILNRDTPLSEDEWTIVITTVVRGLHHHHDQGARA